MSKNKVTHLEQKKQKLREELEAIENALDKSIGKVKEEVSTTLNPKRVIRDYPLPALAASIAIGYLIGRDRKKDTSYPEEKTKKAKKSVLASELKYALTRKGVRLLLDFVDQKVSELKQKDQQGNS